MTTERSSNEQREEQVSNEPAGYSAFTRREVLAGGAGMSIIKWYDPEAVPTNVQPANSKKPIDIGSRLELFVDDYLINKISRVNQRLHPPKPQEIVIEHDEPWEGGNCKYHSIFKDDGVYRMYYQGWEQDGVGVNKDGHRLVTGYAESEDGINWQKPNLGIYEFNGSRENNIIYDNGGDVLDAAHNFVAFKDSNPDRDPDAKYKAIGAIPPKTFKSKDGIHWEHLSQDPILPDIQPEPGYDSQNLAFWDPVDKVYRIYFRGWVEDRRIIKTATSEDFLHWSEAVSLEHPEAPKEQLYTNAIKPYYRAPHILLGFPGRYIERDWESDSMEELPGWERRQERAEVNLRFGAAVTDGLFMTSRDGETFNRWPRAYLRPGLLKKNNSKNWQYGDNYAGWQIVETESTDPGKPRELSLYATEGYWTEASRLRRFTTRIDGFVSMQAPLNGGEFTTKLLQFNGDELVLNFATSAAGTIRLEIQNPGGQPYPGFSLAESPKLFGDDLGRVVKWPNGADINKLAGQPVRLRFVMSDADLYSFRFQD